MAAAAVRVYIQKFWIYQCCLAQIYQYKKVCVPLTIYQCLGIISDPLKHYKCAVLLHQKHLCYAYPLPLTLNVWICHHIDQTPVQSSACCLRSTQEKVIYRINHVFFIVGRPGFIFGLQTIRKSRGLFIKVRKIWIGFNVMLSLVPGCASSNQRDR